jgi:hypothetical protein
MIAGVALEGDPIRSFPDGFLAVAGEIESGGWHSERSGRRICIRLGEVRTRPTQNRYET